MTVRPSRLLTVLSSLLILPTSAYTEYIVNFGSTSGDNRTNISVDHFYWGDYYSYATNLISNSGSASNIHLSIKSGQEVPKLGMGNDPWNNSIVGLPSGLHQQTCLTMDGFTLDFTGLDAAKTYTVSLLVRVQDFSGGASDGVIAGAASFTENMGELISAKYAIGSSAGDWQSGTLINMPSAEGIVTSGTALPKGEWALVEYQFKYTETFSIMANGSQTSHIEKIDIAGISIIESNSIPEPASAGLILLGLGSFALHRRKRP